MKPDTALLIRNRPFYIPDFSEEIHYETELVIKISKNGKNVQEKFAHNYYDKIALGIDFTARDIQRKCKEKGHPWEIAKAFDYSAPISTFIPVSELNNSDKIKFRMDLNDKTVQNGNSKDMIFSFERIISYVSQFIYLKMGDILFTGTPAGVGKVNIGDKITTYLEDRKMLDFMIK